ncbi:MAG: hypothetical protein AW09_001930 [Candidatus Accumulibacter phosphatis]|jgi:hypothetical protein|uniref:Uncharacterized protein n=1 Tax=Candidatus Accumulibacter phosphatis TaxID=327160 RepID=A0A080LW26_9PROT|nr:MAG: hypothetical protein AW09_001930 [Candidatus Accumulibacter phosphatis]
MEVPATLMGASMVERKLGGLEVADLVREVGNLVLAGALEENSAGRRALVDMEVTETQGRQEMVASA